MFCLATDLKTESDVEQKLIWPLLTGTTPTGMGFRPSDVLTKPNTRGLEIGKGATHKLYFPDYIIVIAGLPMIVVEAKAPGEPIEKALTEARLYANELNALFPSGTNPCIRVVACNGDTLATAPTDVAEPDLVLNFSQLSAADPSFARLLELCQRSTVQAHADVLRRSLRKATYVRPVSLVGGLAFQNEELPQNTFGATIVGDYGHIFNPKSPEDRAYIVRNAYIPSFRRQRFVEPIDRLIRAAVTPITATIPILSDTSNPTELTAALRERRSLENQILLLVGSVGSGKSTFIDHLSVVALPQDLRDRTIWLRINLNEAPLSKETAYNWIATSIVDEFRRLFPETDFDEIAALEKVFAPELNALRKGALSLFSPTSAEHLTRLADALMRLQGEPLTWAKCMARYLCAGPGRLLIVVLDNCDKRTRDEQLTMFQIAQWVQHEFRGLVVLPLRDVTFDLHRHEPPLDTALKGLVFRIEPPPFIDVLQARVRLALREMQENAATAQTLSYHLPNGIRVTYPASDQAKYLASILESLYAHDRFVRQVMTGLAGRDVRRALELFLDFCTSGHIAEDEIYKIRFFEGRYVLPLSVVGRVLLRMKRRFYNGDKAHLKNLIQCHPEDALPDHFVRLSILHWLQQRQYSKGPAGVAGFHRVSDLIQSLVHLGHDAQRTQGDLLYLVKEGCVVPEHLRVDALSEGDLVKITASGVVHLQLMANPDYLAACAEDTFLADEPLARRIAGRMSEKGQRFHFARLTTARNAAELIEYLRQSNAERLAAPETYLDKAVATELHTLREAEAAIAATEIEVSRRLFVGNLPFKATEQALKEVMESIGVSVTRVTMPRSESNVDQNRGFAFVDVVDGSAAMRALDASGVQMTGRGLVVNEAYEGNARSGDDAVTHRTEDTPELSERLYVGRLPYLNTEAAVRELFLGRGLPPVDVYVSVDRSTGRSRGYAFVSMASRAAAGQAIGALHGSILDGRSIVVRPAAPRANSPESEAGDA